MRRELTRLGTTLPDRDAKLSGLIAETATGNRGAFRKLYDLTAAKLLGVALRILKDRALAEDVVQEAFLKVWQNAASYTPDAGRPMTWLGAIVRYRAIDVIRGRRESLARTLDVAEATVRAVPDPRDRVTDWMEIERLQRCLDQLAAPQRECFLLAYYEGLSRIELATHYARPVNTISTWLHRSASTLRECLGDE